MAVRLRPKGGLSAADVRPAQSKTDTFSRELTKLDEMKADGKISGAEYDKMRATLIATYQTEPPKEPANNK